MLDDESGAGEGALVSEQVAHIERGHVVRQDALLLRREVLRLKEVLAEEDAAGDQRKSALGARVT